MSENTPPNDPEMAQPDNSNDEQVSHERLSKTKRIVSHHGIEFQCLYYNCPELDNLRKSFSREIGAIVGFDPSDISHIYVQDPTDNDRWFIVPAIEQEYATGLTLEEHQQIRQHILAQRRSIDVVALANARRAIQEIIGHKWATSKRYTYRTLNATKHNDLKQDE